MFNESLCIIYILLIALGNAMALSLGKSGLIAYMSMLGVLANLFVSKQITLFGLNATASDTLAVGITLLLNILQEHFGKESAKKGLQISFFCLVMYTLFSQLQLLYHPSIFDLHNSHFEALLNTMPRITLASLTTFFIIQFIDTQLYSYIKKKLPHISFTIRNYACISFTQFIDTVLFTLLGLYGIIKNLHEIILISYSIKMITIFFLIPLTRFFIRKSNFNVSDPCS